MVWLIGGLPLTAVVAGIATVMIAAHDPDSLVNERHVKQGMAVVAPESAAAARAAALGIGAKVSFKDGRIQVALTGSVGTPPADLRLSLVHPTQFGQDQVLVLRQAGGLTYTASLADPTVTGKRGFILESGDGAWRLSGEGMLSAVELTLTAKSSHSPTHP
jgi:hypothetical protein